MARLRPLRSVRAAAPIAGTAAAAGVALALVAGAAGAQTPPASASTSPWSPAEAAGAPSPWGSGPPAGVTVAPVTVVKTLPGPAIWKATQGSSEVIILGGLTPLPHMLHWDTLRMERALSGADALYLPPRPELGAFGAMKLLLDRGALSLPRGQSLETVLPPPERARFAHVTALIHAKASDYDRYKPAIAGFLLVRDFRKAAGLSDGKPGTTVMHLAEDAHVPVTYVGQVKLARYIDTAARLTPRQNLACFDAAMDDIDQEAAHAPAAARAWANADLKGVGQNYRASLLSGCLEQIPTAAGLLDEGTQEGVTTIRTALLKPGKSVAVIDLNFLLRPNGVLDRLKAQGVDVTVPTE